VKEKSNYVGELIMKRSKTNVIIIMGACGGA